MLVLIYAYMTNMRYSYVIELSLTMGCHGEDVNKVRIKSGNVDI